MVESTKSRSLCVWHRRECVIESINSRSLYLARRTAATLAGSYRCSSLRCPGTMARSICEGGTGTAGNSRSADLASARRAHGLDGYTPQARRPCARGATCMLAPAPMREVAPVTSGGGGI